MQAVRVQASIEPTFFPLVVSFFPFLSLGMFSLCSFYFLRVSLLNSLPLSLRNINSKVLRI